MGRQAARELIERQPSLGLGFGINQIGHGLGLGQVQLLVLKGAAGEFTGQSQPQAKAEQGLKHSARNRRAAMDL